MEKVLWLVECLKSGLQSSLVLLTFWPNNSLLWGCLMHWKMFSSTPGLYSLEANSRRYLTYSKFPNQQSYWWKWKICLLFYRKKLNGLFGQPNTFPLRRETGQFVSKVSEWVMQKLSLRMSTVTLVTKSPGSLLGQAKVFNQDLLLSFNSLQLHGMLLV